jgi:hypothetical protein
VDRLTARELAGTMGALRWPHFAAAASLRVSPAAEVYGYLHEGMTVLPARTSRLGPALLAAKMAVRLAAPRYGPGSKCRRGNNPL